MRTCTTPKNCSRTSRFRSPSNSRAQHLLNHVNFSRRDVCTRTRLARTVIIMNGLALWSKGALHCALWPAKLCAGNAIHGVCGARASDSTIRFANVALVTSAAINAWTIVPSSTTPRPTHCRRVKWNENACRATYCAEDVTGRTHPSVKLVGISKYSR